MSLNGKQEQIFIFQKEHFSRVVVSKNPPMGKINKQITKHEQHNDPGPSRYYS